MKHVSEKKRGEFRVDFSVPIKGTAKILTINNKEVAIDKLIPLSILDLSAGGMRINTSLDFPVSEKITLEIAFTLDREKFNLKGRLLRKLGGTGNEYGIQVVEMNGKEEQRLVKFLNLYQAKSKKVESTHLELVKLNVIKVAAKIIGVLPDPALLVSQEREVVAANKTALANGITLGVKCFATVFQKKDPCAFCKMEEAKKSEEVVGEEIEVRKEKHLLCWLYLGFGHFIYYYKKVED